MRVSKKKKKKTKKGRSGSYETRGKAHARKDPSTKSTWLVEFSMAGQHRARYPNKLTATLAAAKADTVLPLLRSGHLKLPAGLTRAQVRAFVLAGGRLEEEEPRVPTKGPITVGDLRLLYLEGVGSSTKEESSWETERVHLRHLLRCLEAEAIRSAGKSGTRRVVDLHTPAEEISRADIVAYRHWREGSVGSVTINKEVGTISNLFVFGMDSDLLTRNPCKGLKRLRITRPSDFHTQDEIEEILRTGNYRDEEERRIRRARILYPREISELLELAQDKEVLVPLAVAAYQGARRGEIARMGRDHVKLRQDRVTLLSKKKSLEEKLTPRTIDLHPRLRPILQEHVLAVQRGYLFPGQEPGRHIKPGKLHRWLKKLIKETKFEGIGWHTLRHSFASNLARAGVDQRVINHLMDHSTNEMARRYQHLFPEQRKNALTNLYSGETRRGA